MKKFYAGLVALIVASFTQSASAYETDTHLYLTYAMARYAGINHETASVIASAAQWPDETELLGSPMLAELLIGTKMRRLFHFPCPTLVVQGGAQSLSKPKDGNIDYEAFAPAPGSEENNDLLKNLATDISFEELKNNFSPKRAAIFLIQKFVRLEQIDKQYLANINLVCKTEANHPMAYNMLWEGLEEGNLIKAATALHTIEDSFAHAGTPSHLGHSMQGHVPDRCQNAPDKCKDMVRAAMAGIYAIRKGLPQESLNLKYRSKNSPYKKMNYELTVEELHQGFINDPDVRQVFYTDMYKDPVLMRKLVHFFFKMGQQTVEFLGKKSHPWIGSTTMSPSQKPVEQWVNSQADLWAEVDKGQKGSCSITKTGASDKETGSPYADCIVAKFLQRAARDSIKENPPFGLRVNWLKARARLITPTIDGILQSESDRIEAVAAQNKQNATKTKMEIDSIANEAKNQKKALSAERLARKKELEEKYRVLQEQVAEMDRLAKDIDTYYEKEKNKAYINERTKNEDKTETFEEATLGIVQNFLAGYIQHILGNYNRYEFEDEGFLRQYELALRIKNVRDSIFKLTGDYVRFIDNDKTWSYPLTRTKIQNLPYRQPEVLDLPGEYERKVFEQDQSYHSNVKYIGFNYKQIDIWVEMALRYMFPDFTKKYYPADQCSLIAPLRVGNVPEGKLLQPIVDVRDRDEIYQSFLATILNPEDMTCAKVTIPKKIDTFMSLTTIAGVELYNALEFNKVTNEKVERIRRRLRDFQTDFIRSHMKADELMKKFNSTAGIEGTVIPKTNPSFKHWGQLTKAEADEISTNRANWQYYNDQYNKDPKNYKGPEKYKKRMEYSTVGSAERSKNNH
jgi:hypothetical protein